MVCTSDRGRMATMVRLLEIGKIPEKSSAEVASEKNALQVIHAQICDADEANFLEEKDMHVFGWRPLTDPLHLVCCNACKKTIKTSHYSAHAEHCSLVSSTEDIALELDGATGHKKPPKKGRRKVQTDKGREHQKSVSMGGDSAASSESKLDNQNGSSCSPSGDIQFQRIQTSVDYATTADASGICYGGMPASVNYAAKGIDSGICSRGIPGPLATKTYYSHGNHRLRATLGYLYHKLSPKEHGHNSHCVEAKQDKILLYNQAPHPSKSLDGTHNGGLLPQAKVDQQPAFRNTQPRRRLE